MSGENDGKRVAAFFDLDLTITSRDSFRYFLKKQYIDNCRNWALVPQVFIWGISRKLRLISLQRFKEKALVSLFDKERPFIHKTGRLFFDKHLS